MKLPSQFEPQAKPEPVVSAGEFPFAAIGLDHGHIYTQCEELVNAGASLHYVYDPDDKKLAEFTKKFPDVQVLNSEAEVLDKDIRLVAAACQTHERAALGVQVMEAGKDYFVDKAPFISLEQLSAVKAAIAKTGKKFMVFYGERLHSECAMHAGDLIQEGAIGRVVQVLGLGPHRLNAGTRPDWFFQRDKYGGILCDIGSHQLEQFLHYGGETGAEIVSARVDNFAHPDYPELNDFGEASLKGANGCSSYFRVDWFTPDGLSTWGDGRTVILGTNGYIELRKYVDVARAASRDHLYLVTSEDEYYLHLNDKVGFPFFGQLILDCLNRTETAMTQAHALKAGELAVRAQMQAEAV